MKKIFANKIENWIIAIVTVAIYGITEIMTFRSGFFWISASVSYVIPIFFLFLFIYLYSFRENKENKNNKVSEIIALSIIIFMATFSQEQIGIASLMYISILTVYNTIKNKKIDKVGVLLTIVSCIGFAILMLAPGNQLRKQHPTSIEFYQMPIIERTGTGIAETIVGNFGQYNKIFTFFFFSTVLCTIIKSIQKNIGIRWLNTLSLLSTAGIFLIMFIKPEGYFYYVYHLKESMLYKLVITTLTLLQLGLIGYSITIYLWNRKSKELLFLFYCGIISQGVMIIAPYFALRSNIIFEYIYYIIGLTIIGDIFSKKEYRKIVACTVFPFLLLCICNMIIITKGYLLNSDVNKENHNTLLDVQQQIMYGNKIQEITLKKLPNLLYSGEQPYVEGNEYILYYIKQYYNLPNEFIIRYE